MKDEINKRLQLIRQGKFLKDKFFLSIWALLSASSIFLKQDGYKYLFHDVILKNEYGTFICRKGKGEIRQFTDYDIDLSNEISLEKGVFIDIGANIGKYSIKVGKKADKVIAIEIMPENFLQLEKNISLNKLNNIIPINIGCFSRNDNMAVFIDDLKSSTGTNSLVKIRGKKKIYLPVKKLDLIVKENRLIRIDLIKIDVEGAELNVIQGGLNSIKKYKPKIIFEINDNLKDIIKLLLPLGYKIKNIGKCDAIAEYKK